MKVNSRTLLIIGALAVAGYLGYRWWANRQSGGQLGANLNSVAPEMIAGSSSGVTYVGGSTTVNLEEPVTQDNGNKGIFYKRNLGGAAHA